MAESMSSGLLLMVKDVLRPFSIRQQIWRFLGGGSNDAIKVGDAIGH